MIRCLIVDDEPLAHKVLERYISGLDYLEVVDHCYDGLSAINRIAQGGIDAILLDVQMPDLTGLELLDALKVDSPLVVLTTAYSEYAVDSFGYDQVVDYLQKPIKLARFLQAAERLRKRVKTEQAPQLSEFSSTHSQTSTSSSGKHETMLLLQDDRVTHRISSVEVNYLESYGNYVKAHLISGQVTIGRRTLSSLESELADFNFLRVHKRFVVNTKNITSVESAAVLIGDVRIPIGKSHAEEVRLRLVG
ncbi:MAG: LytR/AlgR family response regulator transcription factor [Saprospiraceae bacterium]